MSDQAGVPSRDDRECVRATLILGAFAFLAALAVYAFGVKPGPGFPRDTTTLVVGRDFFDFWANARAAWGGNPGRLYDPHALAAALAPFVGPHYFGQTWAYPPLFLLLVAPFGLLPYLPALFIWSALGLGAFVWSAFAYIPNRSAALAAIVSPAAMLCLVSGQASFLFAALFLAIFAQLDRRPILAGILIGFVALKPQLALLFPVLLIATGRWRTFAAATGTVVILAGLTVAFWGPEIWLDYWNMGTRAGSLVLSDPKIVVAPFMPTVFMNAREAGADYGVAMLIQMAVGLLAVAALLFGCRSRSNTRAVDLPALFLACSLCAVPYMLSYDTLALAAACMLLLASGELDGLGRRLVQLVYWLPLIQIGLGAHHVPGPAVVAIVFIAYVLLRHAGEGRARSQPSPSALPALQ